MRCDVDQPLEVGNELRADKMSVRAWHLLRENLHERAVATRNHMAHVDQLAEDQIVQCREEPVEVGRACRHNEEWRIPQNRRRSSQPLAGPSLQFSFWPGK